MKNIIKLLKSKSFRYIIFRSKYELERRVGLLVFKYPTKLKEVQIPTLNDWRKRDFGWFFFDRNMIHINKCKSADLKEKMERIKNGEVLFFSKVWYNLGLDYDWVTNPETGYRYNVFQHWTKINDFSREAGDIKFVWEKSRFTWLLTVCRYDYHFNEDHSEFVISQILNWIIKNPLNCGPNYKCSQEISLRILNWLFALTFYKNSEFITEDRWRTIISSIYWQTNHIMSNINFSRIAVRNNHAITETLTLYIMGMMFPMMKGANSWKKKGKRWFEEEIDYQIEEDGTFIQDSMNYHRVLIQLLTYAIALADKNEECFSQVVYDKAYKSLNFLFQCQEPSSGWLPNYGSNDGSLFFPLSDNDYRDYRPQLDALHKLLTGCSLYSDTFEDSHWLGCYIPNNRDSFAKVEKKTGLIKFENSGYYLIRESDTLSFIRCGLFKNNGSTDLMHLDVWYKRKNILMDGGSYMYNADLELVRYFSGTESHNSVMLGDDGQMQKGIRFIWYYPPTLQYAELREDNEFYIFEGCVNAYKQIKDDILFHRVVKKNKYYPEWIIIDTIEGVPDDIIKRQIWHVDSELNFVSDAIRVDKCGWISDYYGVKRPISQIEFQEKKKRIITKIKIV